MRFLEILVANDFVVLADDVGHGLRKMRAAAIFMEDNLIVAVHEGVVVADLVVATARFDTGDDCTEGKGG